MTGQDALFAAPEETYVLAPGPAATAAYVSRETGERWTPRCPDCGWTGPVVADRATAHQAADQHRCQR